MKLAMNQYLSGLERNAREESFRLRDRSEGQDDGEKVGSYALAGFHAPEDVDQFFDIDEQDYPDDALPMPSR
jgi:hypothetical protein